MTVEQPPLAAETLAGLLHYLLCRNTHLFTLRSHRLCDSVRPFVASRSCQP